MKQQDTAPITPETDRKDKSGEAIQPKSQLLNPAWSEEVVAILGITGPLGKELGGQLSAAIEKDVKKSWSRARLSKLVRKFAVKTIK